MLEIKGVTKIYKSRGGVETRALDNVTLSFGETGFVFLLGKSGSGKSTLLNVSGGLDEPTSGEIIVNGKSSKDFSGSDFDSYRNTFVGFVFQEYNVLDEFNVEDNIALALELQGKKKDAEKIRSILKEVELENYARRKPNTLSGGQKQRIAIARALVKEPRIIMADEPTGALDSATGKQVFETLKELSKTRLVIVVSHDREFAEIYGDRIIELKDGKVISDVSKTTSPPEKLDDNVSIIGGNTLSIKKGAILTEENFRTIKNFIAASESGVIISNGETEINSFKKVNRMSAEGHTEKFENTQDFPAQDSGSISPPQFIRSKLPAAKALKIGASGLKIKPVRLAFTILLSVIAFIMFGLTSTLMLYNGTEVAINTFAQSDYEYLNITKSYRVTSTRTESGYSWVHYENTRFTPDEFADLKSDFGENSIAYYSSGKGSLLINSIPRDGSDTGAYYLCGLDKFAEVPQGNALRDGLIGTYPERHDEICISSYTLECFKRYGSYNVSLDEFGQIGPFDVNDIITVNNANDLIGRLMVLSNKPFKITGVFQSGDLPSKYEPLKTDNKDVLLNYEFNNYLADGLSCMAMVSEDFYGVYIKPYTETQENPFHDCLEGISILGKVYAFEDSHWVEKPDMSYILGNSVCAYTADGAKAVFLGGNNGNSLSDNQVLLPSSFLNSNLYFNAFIKHYYDDDWGDYGDQNERNKAYIKAFDKYYALTKKVESYEKGYCMDESGNPVEFTETQLEELFSEIKAEYSELPVQSVKISLDDRTFNMQVAGFYLTENKYAYNAGVYFSQKFIDDNVHFVKEEVVNETDYVLEKDAIYAGVMISFDRTKEQAAKVFSFVGKDGVFENGVCYNLSNGLYGTVEMANGTVEMLSIVFLWVGCIFAVFSSLLLFNFISVSISNKRKEIGILRAVGARGLDVFKIFFSESGIIVGICAVLAVVGTFIISAVINGVLKSSIGLQVTLFVVGVPSVAILFAVAFAVAVISTFLPVFFASRKKPVDSIRAL